MIFTILQRVPLMVEEPLMYKEPPQSDPLLIRAFICFRLKCKWVPVGPQDWEYLIRGPVGARVILVNVMKHIVEVLPGLGPPHPIDGSLFVWINNKHTLHVTPSQVRYFA